MFVLQDVPDFTFHYSSHISFWQISQFLFSSSPVNPCLWQAAYPHQTYILFLLYASGGDAVIYDGTRAPDNQDPDWHHSETFGKFREKTSGINTAEFWTLSLAGFTCTVLFPSLWDHFSALLTMLDRAILLSTILSVRLSVRHTREPRLDG